LGLSPKSGKTSIAATTCLLASPSAIVKITFWFDCGFYSTIIVLKIIDPDIAPTLAVAAGAAPPALDSNPFVLVSLNSM